MSIINIQSEQEDGISSHKHMKGFFNRKGLRRLIASFLCAAIILSANFVVPVKTEAAVKLSASYLWVKKGTATTLKLKGANASKVTWSLSNPFVGTINNGRFTATWSGMTKVTATYKKKNYICKIIVPDVYRTIYLNKYKLTLKEKASFNLKASGMGQMKYRSTNTHIARVDSRGKITAVNPGSCTIITYNGLGDNKCKVKVKSAGKKAPSFAKWLYDKNKLAIRKNLMGNQYGYGPINTTAGKNLVLGVDNVNQGKVRKIVWSSSNKQVAEVTPRDKIKLDVKILRAGTTKISAVIFYTDGKSTLISNYIYVSNPVINTYKAVCFTKKSSLNKTQYISFSGLNSHSVVKFKIPKTKKIKTKVSYNKVKITGKKKCSGNITAKVDGKVFKVNYLVRTPKKKPIIGVLAKGNTTKINITGIKGVQPIYTSRNTSIATVALDGTITGKSSGVTRVDVQIGSVSCSYRVEVSATGMKTIINRAKYIVNNWTYSQGNRMADGFYDCSALVWKGYKAYNNYNAKLGSTQYALPAASLFDYLRAKGQIPYFGFTKLDDMHPGDLFFYGDYSSAVRYSTPGRTLNIYHVAMYAGNGRVVEKGTPRYTYNSLDHIVGVGRVVY